ncbi:MAG: hypothetical protein ACI8RD_014820, partial [Bacillariaceae sp.]
YCTPYCLNAGESDDDVCDIACKDYWMMHEYNNSVRKVR